jgi:recombination protein RecA
MASLAETIAAKINKEMGEGTIITGAQLRDQIVSYLSTGSLVFDVMYGGGFVQNQWNEIVGLESSGKTLMALKCVAYHQAADLDFLVLWVAAEDLDIEWCATLGVDIERMIIIPSNVMEHVYDMVIRFIDEQAVDLVVIDSLPALVPLDEDAKTMEEFTVGLAARLNGKFFRKSAHALKRSLVEEERPCTAVIINQWRDRIGVMRGDPRTTPGGKAKNYAFWTRVDLSRIEWITQGKDKIGQTIKARTFKNKAAPVQREAEIDFYFDEGGPVPVGSYDTLKEIVNVALAFGVIERRGAMYDFRGEVICKGRDGLYDLLRSDPGLAEKISADVMARVRGEEPEVAPEPSRRRIKRRAE